MYAAIGLSIEQNPILAAQEAIDIATTKIDSARSNLAIVFSSVDLAFPILLKTLSSSLGRVPVIGCSGAAIICNDGIFKHGLALMLLSLTKEEYFNMACVKDISAKTSLIAGKELGEKLTSEFKDIRRVFSVIFSDGLMNESSSFIQGLQEKLGKSFPLVGGSASDNLRFLKTYIYFNQELLSDSAAGILWGGKLNYGLGIKHGWKPLGKPRVVTKAQGNIAYEIDGEAAVKIYEDYLGRNLTQLQKELQYVSVLYPIGIYLEGEEEYLLRNTISIEHNGSLRLQGNIAEGNLIRLMIGTKESCLAATRQALEEAKKGIFSQTKDYIRETKIGFALIFDSVSRYILLKRDADKELEIIKEGLGENTPIIGLYTYGEQAPLSAISYQGQAYSHNQTIAVLTAGD